MKFGCQYSLNKNCLKKKTYFILVTKLMSHFSLNKNRKKDNFCPYINTYKPKTKPQKG